MREAWQVRGSAERTGVGAAALLEACSACATACGQLATGVRSDRATEPVLLLARDCAGMAALAHAAIEQRSPNGARFAETCVRSCMALLQALRDYEGAACRACMQACEACIAAFAAVGVVCTPAATFIRAATRDAGLVQLLLELQLHLSVDQGDGDKWQAEVDRIEQAVLELTCAPQALR